MLTVKSDIAQERRPAETPEKPQKLQWYVKKEARGVLKLAERKNRSHWLRAKFVSVFGGGQDVSKEKIRGWRQDVGREKKKICSKQFYGDAVTILGNQGKTTSILKKINWKLTITHLK